MHYWEYQANHNKERYRASTRRGLFLSGRTPKFLVLKLMFKDANAWWFSRFTNFMYHHLRSPVVNKSGWRSMIWYYWDPSDHDLSSLCCDHDALYDCIGRVWHRMHISVLALEAATKGLESHYFANQISLIRSFFGRKWILNGASKNCPDPKYNFEQANCLSHTSSFLLTLMRFESHTLRNLTWHGMVRKKVPLQQLPRMLHKQR